MNCQQGSWCIAPECEVAPAVYGLGYMPKYVH